MNVTDFTAIYISVCSYKFITTTVVASFKLRDKMFYLELQFAFSLPRDIYKITDEVS